MIPGSVKFRPASPPRHSCANILCLYCFSESVTIVTFTDLNCLKYKETCLFLDTLWSMILRYPSVLSRLDFYVFTNRVGLFLCS